MIPVDDLTEARCARCGTDRELTRPNSLFLNGRFYGVVVCTDCHAQLVGNPEANLWDHWEDLP